MAAPARFESQLGPGDTVYSRRVVISLDQVRAELTAWHAWNGAGLTGVHVLDLLEQHGQPVVDRPVGYDDGGCPDDGTCRDRYCRRHQEGRGSDDTDRDQEDDQ